METIFGWFFVAVFFYPDYLLGSILLLTLVALYTVFIVKKSRRGLIGLTKVLLSLIILYAAVNYIVESDWERSIVGTSLYGEKELYSYDSIRSLQGNGYNIRILKLNSKHIKDIQENFLRGGLYPVYREYSRKGWEHAPWKQGVLSELENNILEFATTVPAGFGEELDSDIAALVRDSMNTPDAYYAYDYTMGYNWPDGAQSLDGLDLYVLDINRGILIVINRI